ncbi:MAG: primosomal protein N' [Desulfovibrionaceae bacterium]
MTGGPETGRRCTMKEYWQILLPSPPYSVLTYERPDWFPALEPGCRVLVPMRRSLRVGVLMQMCPKPEFATKPLLWALDRTPLLDADYMDLVQTMASRQMTEPGAILGQLLPAGLRVSDLTFTLDRGPFPSRLSPRELSRLSDKDKGTLLELWRDGAMRVLLNPGRESDETIVRLLADPPWPVRPNAQLQMGVLEYLLENGPATRRRLSEAVGPNLGPVLRRLAEAGLVCVERSGESLADLDNIVCEPHGDYLVSSPEQEAALESLLRAQASAQPETALLHGVTGSGKTHVYLELAAACLDSGKPALLLAPEVALACGLFKAVQKRFPQQRCLFYHGYQTPSQRRDTFLALAEQGPVLVVGTRSALFLPLRRPGLIVIDEEHDESFKQEERLAYQAKEIAWYRVQQSGGLLVLGSATPDVKTFQAARLGSFPVHSLTKRVGGGTVPDIQLVDIAGFKDPDNPLAASTLQALSETVEQGGQAIVMLNRRGYAPLMYCLDCGDVVRCPNCHVSMTYHKNRERLVCHYCGLSHPYPLLCSGCGGGNHLPMGEGTERMEEVLVKALPEGTGILRMDRDTTRRPERLEQILDDFSKERAQVLVGTQMLSKGHHFPNVTLVVVADGDLGLNLPDYRSAERTYQLLLQVAGRAGRGVKSGKVLVQTRNPGHPFWSHVLQSDYVSFFEQEIAKRENFRYPPFVRLGLIRLSVPMDDTAGGLPKDAAAALQRAAQGLDVTVLGPAPAPLAMLRGRQRFNCLIKAADWRDVRMVFKRMSAWNPEPERIRLRLDLDPVNML